MASSCCSVAAGCLQCMQRLLPSESCLGQRLWEARSSQGVSPGAPSPAPCHGAEAVPLPPTPPISTSPHLPPIRASMEAAEGLYNQLEEEVHDLVSQSNSCLERLEFLQKVRELEAEFGKVSGAAPGAGRSQSPPGTAP